MRRPSPTVATALLVALAAIVPFLPPTAATGRPAEHDAADRKGAPPDLRPRAKGPRAPSTPPAPPVAPEAAPAAGVAPAASRTWTVGSVTVEPLHERSWTTVEGVGDYRGRISVRNAAGGLAVIDELPLEQYLLGLAEVPASWPIEAQKAQAIAARTYALHEAANPAVSAARAAGADLCATDACQVYAGLAKERGADFASWRAAVQATRGEVLLDRGRPILAKYSSSNGGRSIPGGKPYLRAVDDPDDAYSPYHRWRVSVALPELVAAFGLAGTPEAVSRDGDTVVIAVTGPSGRTVTSVPAADFRARLNSLPAPEGLPRVVPSLRFDVALDAAAGVVVLDGRGWGHGIGMSQYGALGKAVRGMRAADIVAAYYGGIRPTALPADPRPIRVAVALGATETVLTGPGRFRVLDDTGATLAVAAEGRWTVRPGPSGAVVVSAPAGSAAAPRLERAAVEPARPVVGLPSRLRFRLDTPAVVRVVVRGPGGLAPAAVPVTRPTLVAGDGVASLPALPSAGRWSVVIEADAGGGRTATSTVEVDVLAPAPGAAAALAAPTTGRTGDDGVPPLAPTAAAVALAAVGSATVRRFRDQRLH